MSDPAKPADEKLSPSGIPIAPVYRPSEGPVPAALGEPGAFPFTRGVQPTMYRGRFWTMRQYAGFGTAQETNARFKLLLEAGQTGLSTAFDLPTQMGLDSDSSRSLGEVGRVGVAIDSVEDLHALLDGIPLDKVSTSMTINATAAVLLAMYVVVAEERGIPRAKLSGTIQNDILKEYIARGTYVFPPEPSARGWSPMTFRFCAPRCRSSIRSRSPATTSARPGSTAVQELAFTFGNAIAYVAARHRRRAAIGRLRAAKLSLLLLPATTTSSRRSRSSAPPVGSTRCIIRERFHCERRELPDAPLPHPDSRRTR
jgi:methylmalonyl-CoA mutase N-terminal domain/subunit